MKKLILTVLTSILTISFCFSQDTLKMKSSENLQAKILEVTPTEIKYKRFDNLSGPIFTILKSNVLMILYENGTKDIFAEEEQNQTVTMSDEISDSLFFQGQEDALTHYRGYKGAGTGTLIASLVSPLVGLIPAVACSSTPPDKSTLNYQRESLMNKPDYANGYKRKSK
jgi:hypothetical protein